MAGAATAGCANRWAVAISAELALPAASLALKGGDPSAKMRAARWAGWPRWCKRWAGNPKVRSHPAKLTAVWQAAAVWPKSVRDRESADGKCPGTLQDSHCSAPDATS